PGDGTWPSGTASLRVESDTALLTFVTLGSAAGTPSEVVLAAGEPAAEIAFPVGGLGDPAAIDLTVLNAGTAPASLFVLPVAADGHALVSVPLPALAPMAQRTWNLAELLSPTVLGSTAAVHVVADQPLAGVLSM